MLKKFVVTSLLAASVLVTAGTPTKAIEGPVYAPVMPGNNITSSFSNTMLKNAATIAYYAMNEKKRGTYPIGTGDYFASMVKSRGPWDYKHAYGTTTKYVYNGKSITGEGLGNMHYGYVGRAAGFSSTILKAAAGAVQIYSGTSYVGWYKSYFDDPNDQYWITYGIGLWGKDLPKSSPSYIPSEEEILIDNELSEEELFNLLSPEEKTSIEEQVIIDSETIEQQ
jgi:Bacterial toxin 44